MGRQTFIHTIVRFMIVVAAVFVLTAYVNMHASAAQAEGTAFIRVVHASPDVGTVDVFMDGKKLLSSFQYASVSNYLPLPPGPHQVDIALIGKGINAPVITQTLPVNAGIAYTIAALGMQSTKNLALKVFEDDNTIVGNSAKVRIYHFSPGTSSVDITEGMNKVVGGVAYTQASNYVSIPAGAYMFDMNITLANTTIPISVQLNRWTVTSFFAIGLLNSDPRLKLVVAQTTGTPALPQTGGGPILQVDGAQPVSDWWIAILICVFIFAINKGYYWIKASSDTPGK